MGRPILRGGSSSESRKDDDRAKELDWPHALDDSPNNNIDGMTI